MKLISSRLPNTPAGRHKPFQIMVDDDVAHRLDGLEFAIRHDPRNEGVSWVRVVHPTDPGRFMTGQQVARVLYPDLNSKRSIVPKDGNILNLQRENLEVVDHRASEAYKAKEGQRRATQGSRRLEEVKGQRKYVGYFTNDVGNFAVRLRDPEGTRHHIGTFKVAEEAARAYDLARLGFGMEPVNFTREELLAPRAQAE